ncbi:MAG: LUD domain-containing protein [Patescibacteria group bacterium]|nr:LUD domain-containing protein [Patescibacteria group bacterium]
MDYSQVASLQTLETVAAALEQNGFKVEIAQNAAEAKDKALALIPEGAEVLNATSITLEQIGVAKEITESGRYKAIKNQLAKMDRKTQHREMQRLGSAPEYEIGSAHAVTQDGRLLIASNTGSQLPGEVFSADHVIFVVGAQKIVENLQQGLDRIRDYVTPKESVRARKAYALPDSYNSFASKLVIFSREPVAGRTHIILVKEALGF